MGRCASSPISRVDENSHTIDKELQRDSFRRSRFVRVLMLGLPEAGVSTLCRQLQLTVGDGFWAPDKAVYGKVIRSNVIHGLQQLVHDVYDRDDWKFASKDSEDAATRVLAVAAPLPLAYRHIATLPASTGSPQPSWLEAAFTPSLFAPSGKWFAAAMPKLSTAHEEPYRRAEEKDPPDLPAWSAQFVNDLRLLWNEPAILAAKQQRNLLQLCFYFEEIERIAEEGYLPPNSHVMRASAHVNGATQQFVQFGGADSIIFTPGMQRGRLHKWLHRFEDMNGTFFVVDLSDYNRLPKALEFFELVVNSTVCEETICIVLFNKMDEFQAKFCQQSIRVCFPEYAGLEDPEAVREYITARFRIVDRRKQRVVVQTCVGTDTVQIERMWDTCKLAILENSLQRLGLSDL